MPVLLDRVLHAFPVECTRVKAAEFWEPFCDQGVLDEGCDLFLLDVVVVSPACLGHSLHSEDAQAGRAPFSEELGMVTEVEVLQLSEELGFRAERGSHGSL